MNSLTITGNLTRDAELRSLKDGTAVLSFAVADNQGKDKTAIFWNCALFGKRAESLQQYLTKGQQVTVIGAVSEREWTDKEGNKRKSMDVRVSDIALQGGKREEREAPRQRGENDSYPARKRAREEWSGGDSDASDIPFSDPLRSRALCLAC